MKVTFNKKQFTNSHFTKRSLATFLSLLLCSLAFVETAQAQEPEVKIRDEGYAAKFVSQSIADPIQMVAGEKKTVVIKFKNVGTVAWDEKSARYVSAYTMEPRDRASVFKGTNWKNAKQTGRMKGKVAPGAVGELSIELIAPEKTGEYIEKFYLAAENYSWVKNGYFFLQINVEEKTSVVSAKENAIGDKDVASSTMYKSKLIGINKKHVTAQGGERIDLIAIYQNLGGVAWNNYRIIPLALADSDGNLIGFAGENWVSNTVAVERKEVNVVPDASAREEFYFRAPHKEGNYIVSFEVEIDGQRVAGTPTNT